MKLIKPDNTLKSEFFEVIEDYKKNQEWFYYYKYDRALEDYEGYLADLDNFSKGIGLGEDQVPTSVYWLVDDQGTEIRGIIRIRHEAIPVHGNIGYDVPPKMRFKGYGRELLRLGIIKAHELGVDEVRISCSTLNEGSKKVIESNGGELTGTKVDNFERFNLYIIR